MAGTKDDTLPSADEGSGAAKDRRLIPGRVAFNPLHDTDKPQEYYDRIKQRFAEARDLRLSYRPEGRAQYTSDASDMARYEVDPYAGEATPRAPLNDTVEVLFIGG